MSLDRPAHHNPPLKIYVDAFPGFFFFYIRAHLTDSEYPSVHALSAKAGKKEKEKKRKYVTVCIRRCNPSALLPPGSLFVNGIMKRTRLVTLT